MTVFCVKRNIRWRWVSKADVAMFFKIGVLNKIFAIFIGKHWCYSLFFTKLQAYGLQLYLKETPTQVFSCEYYEIFKRNCFYRTPLIAVYTQQHQ